MNESNQQIEIPGSVPAAYMPYVQRVRHLTLPEALQYTATVDRFVAVALLKTLKKSVYAPGKWTVPEMLQHVIDTERVFQYRALRIARGGQKPLEGFDENEFARNSKSAEASIDRLADEMEAVRRSTQLLFESFRPEVLALEGVISGKKASVAAIAYVIAGHAMHHFEVIRQKYIPLLKDLGLVSIANHRPEWNVHFERLNKSWIEKYFVLEQLDRYVLEQPQQVILDTGGHIFFATCAGEVMGAVALMRVNSDTMELTKMAVDERYQGIGAGKLLCSHAIEVARQNGVRKLVLYTQDSLDTALMIYKKLGFQEVELEPGVYSRANVKMEMRL